MRMLYASVQEQGHPQVPGWHLCLGARAGGEGELGFCHGLAEPTSWFQGVVLRGMYAAMLPTV
jgi:hypothetical protein